MQNMARIALGLGAAALVASGGSAFTAATPISGAADEHLGYGAVQVHGVTVDNIEYRRTANTPSTVNKIIFLLANGQGISDTNNNAEVRLNDQLDGSVVACTIVDEVTGGSPAKGYIDCTVNVPVVNITYLYLSVTPDMTA